MEGLKMRKRNIMAILVAAALGLSLTSCGSAESTAKSESASSAKSESAGASSSASAASSASGTSSSGGDEKFTIAWVDGNLANESNAVCSDAAKAYAESQGMEFLLLDGQGSGETQVSQCETLIAQGVDCVIVQPYDAAACQVGVQACIDAGVNVLVTKTTIEDNSICPFVGQDDVVAGEMEMEWIAEKLGGKGNIVIIEGPTGISAAINRNDGIENVLKNYPDINVLHTQPADWNRDEGMALMETWLQTGEQIDAVVAHNDEMALGAYDAIADAGLAGQIYVIGIDAIDAAKKSVADGELDATVLQDVETIGQKTVEVAIAMCKGEKVDDVYNIDPILLTKDNVGDY